MFVVVADTGGGIDLLTEPDCIAATGAPGVFAIELRVVPDGIDGAGVEIGVITDLATGDNPTEEP